MHQTKKGNQYYFAMKVHVGCDVNSGAAHTACVTPANTADITVMPDLLRISDEVGIPLLAANDSHYTYAAEADAHDVLLCIQTGANKSDQDRFKFDSQEFYIKTAGEMRGLFPADEFPDACANTLLIAERADVSLEFGQMLLPPFPVPEGMTGTSYLRQLVLDGARERYGAVLDTEVEERIDYELRVIDEMGAVSSAISGGHWWFEELASTLVGWPSRSALKTAESWWQPMSPRTPVPKSHQPRQAKG